MNDTLDKIRLLAPDEGTFERAKGLAHSYQWKEIAGNEYLVYGIFNGQREQRYQTQWGVEKNIWRCTCPSRKNPCKHILALMLLHIKEDESIRPTDVFPEDIEAWLEESENVKEKTEPKVATTTKSREKRLEEMATGIAELEIWMMDIIGEGLASLDHRDENYWLTVSAKMFDAKLSGIGRRMRNFSYLNGQEQL